MAFEREKNKNSGTLKVNDKVKKREENTTLTTKMAYGLKQNIKFKKGVLNGTELGYISNERFKNKLRPYNSDDDSLPAYILNRWHLFSENQTLRRKLLMQMKGDEAKLHIGFLHASPLVFKVRSSKQIMEQLSFMEEA